MRKSVIVCAAVLVTLFALSACGGSSAASTAQSSSASSQEIVTDSESVVIISLDYNAGTGFEWSYEEDPEGMLTFLGKETEDLAKDELIDGGPLLDTFTFRAAKPGEVTLTFKLARSWEESPSDYTQVYAFDIDENLHMVLLPDKSNYETEPEWGSNA